MQYNSENNLNASGDFSKRQQALAKRQEYLSLNPESFAKNSSTRREYLNDISNLGLTLTEWQEDLVIGLVLSDASLQTGGVNAARGAEQCATRLKLQQTTRHINFVEHLQENLLEYTSISESSIHAVDSRDKMLEFVTLRCSQFSKIAELFSKGPIEPNKVVRKELTEKLIPYITPATVAYWFCGDGGKADFTPNKGKGISFHTQCFTKEECLLLVNGLSSNLGLDASLKLDNKAKNQYRIDLPGNSFDKFIEVVGPYIHESMVYKLPSPRTPNSRHGKADQAFCNRYLSQAFLTPNYITEYRRPKF